MPIKQALSDHKILCARRNKNKYNDRNFEQPPSWNDSDESKRRKRGCQLSRPKRYPTIQDVLNDERSAKSLETDVCKLSR